MGILRVTLAIAVVISHTFPPFGVELMGGRVAVETFFIISGFYMSLILNEKYVGKGSYGLFISNRFIRIYSVYFAVLILTIVYTVLEYHNPAHMRFPSEINGFSYAVYKGVLGIWAWVYVIFSNLVLFGMDAAIFFGLDVSSGKLFFTTNFRDVHPSMIEFLLVPQAWTLALELMFYVMAPFLVRKRMKLAVGLILIGTACRLVTYYGFGLTQSPWTDMFFPNELPLFLMGIISYRIYAFVRTTALRGAALGVPCALFLLLSFCYQLLPEVAATKWCYYAAATCLIPFVYAATKSSRLDRYIGELSYPLYLCHILVIWFLRPILLRHDLMKQAPLWVIPAAVLLSLLLVEAVVRPVDRYRQSRVGSKAVAA